MRSGPAVARHPVRAMLVPASARPRCAPAGVLTTLPGIDEDLARRIVATREEVGLFSAVDDLTFALDLPPGRVEVLRGVAVAIGG